MCVGVMVLSRNLLVVALCLGLEFGWHWIRKVEVRWKTGWLYFGSVCWALCGREKWTGVGTLCCRHISEVVYVLLLVRVYCMKVWNRTVCWSLW